MTDVTVQFKGENAPFPYQFTANSRECQKFLQQHSLPPERAAGKATV